MKGIIFGCLFLGFTLLFGKIRKLRWVAQLWKRTKISMDAAARERLLRNRSSLTQLQRQQSLWIFLERQLQYSGITRRFPFLTVEVWLLSDILVLALWLVMSMAVVRNIGIAFLTLGFPIGLQLGVLSICRWRELRSVENNLLKFLDFLGNYSLTAGEITGILGQISKYVDEPMRSALDSCYFEAQTTGDVGMALLSMAEKIEHPKFKELVRNLEISCRYCADFTSLVGSSRRSVREYLRMGEERKGLLREAAWNLLMLLFMSVVVLLAVDGLVETSIWSLLRDSIPGRIAIFVFVSILVLFLRQMYRIHR